MEPREIQSPEPVVSEAISHISHRKKLSIHFADSDERQFPWAIGGEYVAGGTTPVTIRGKPIENLSQTGGWVAAFFIFGNEMAERMAYFGLSVNMVAFMFYIMHHPFTSSANTVNNFLGISQASSVLGGFLADAYLGRYWTIAIFTTIYIFLLSGGSPLTRVAQVLVAAFRKRNVPFSSSELVGLYEVAGKRSAIKGSGKLEHTDDFRCLDKAALQLKEDRPEPSRWRLCTITQVEVVKILLKLLPIPA
ncbi:protein NRT1/ PTR FAMILY 6.1 isoform X3 [Carex littledalei]|uniref:Protein NRT1/ PTR FAMILY 6.1 isoform X3 n=1 Tax=Carex littledalei TaxID=544730 RepID=A0A833VBL6_9POAL|nr:protein NRT1/ PTR FAMILY 6.1 isoform X3 [Carex littledalei]